MLSTILRFFKVWRAPMEYHREIVNLGFGEDGSDMHIVHANGLLIVYSYDDWRRTELDGYVSSVHDNAIAIAKRLNLPVRYYYRGFNSGQVEYVHYDYSVRSIRMCYA